MVKKSAWQKIVILAFLLDSGSWIGIQNALIYDSVLLVCAGITMLLDRQSRIKKDNFITYAVVVVTFFVNALFYNNDGLVINGYISYTIRITSALLLASSLAEDSFADDLLDWIVTITALSLIIFAFSFLSKGAYYSNKDGYYLMYFRIFRVYESFLKRLYRNAAIFWEPGAFQMFANLALCILFRNRHFKIDRNTTKKEWVSLIILSLGIVTTFSTTGYIIYGLIISVVVWNSIKNLPARKIIVVFIPALLAFSYAVVKVFQTETIYGKIFGDNTTSFSIRNGDVALSLKILSDRPLIGYGFGTETMWNAMREIGRTSYVNSSGFLMAAATFGIAILLVYLFRLPQYSKRYYGRMWFLFFLVIFLSGMTEGFSLYPVFFIMLFSFSDNMVKDKVKQEG